MAKNKFFLNKGFTLIEVLVVTGILVLMAGFSVVSLTSFGRNNNIDGDYSLVTSSLRQVESNSLANLGDSQWGLYLESNRVIIFTGSDFNSTDISNKVKFFSNGTVLSWNLSSGGQTILFDKGKTSTVNFGMLILSNSGNSKNINLNSEGGIE